MLLVKICIGLMALFHGGRVRLPLQESRSSKAERIALIQRWLREIQDRLTIIPGVRGGVGLLDVRAPMELGAGALIFTTYGGVVDLGPEGHNLFLKPILPPCPDLRIVPRYYTGHPEYLWLNRLQCVGVGVFDVAQSRVSYDIYAMR